VRLGQCRALGIPVHPCIPSGKLTKIPYIAGWETKATTEPT
jgi:hypothetical protein